MTGDMEWRVRDIGEWIRAHPGSDVDATLPAVEFLEPDDVTRVERLTCAACWRRLPMCHRDRVYHPHCEPGGPK